MVIYLILLALLCLTSVKISLGNGFNDYMSPRETGAIKGVFVIIVLLSHIRQYVHLEASPFNTPYSEFMAYLGQLMVVMFLFYSGYGVALGIQNKEGYIRSLPIKRAFKVFLHFALAVLLFAAVSFCLGKEVTLKKLLCSFLGLDAFGNSAWFIFVIVILYLLTFAAFVFIGKNHMIAGTAVTTLLCAAAVLVIRAWKGSDYWWYDTIMCYPLGMWFALAKPRIDKLILPDFSKWFACTASVAVIFSFLKYLMPCYGNTRRLFIPASLFFALLIVLISMRVKIGNDVLCWFGKRVFGIYILQRIPMMLLSHFGANEKPFLFTAAVFALTIVIAEIFERATDKLDIALHLSKKKTSKPIGEKENESRNPQYATR